MKKRVCQWQSVMLETRLNVHISRCENKACKNYLTPVNEKICNSCMEQNPIGDEDEVVNSMTEVFDVKLNEQSDHILAHLFDNYCAECSKQDEE